jgi:ribose 5-phosphate isomerase B
MRVAVTADHNGIATKARLVALLTAAGHEVDDRNPDAAAEQVVDYPDLCADVCRLVTAGPADRAVVVGGSGMGEVVVCNKFRGVRAGLAVDRWHVDISRGNNDSNVLVVGAKYLTPEQAEELVELWLRTPFKGGVHAQRVARIAELEQAELS